MPTVLERSRGSRQLTLPNGRYRIEVKDMALQSRRAHDGDTHAPNGRIARPLNRVRCSELLPTPDHRPQHPDRYRVRLYDEWFAGGWKRAIALLNATAAAHLVIPYYRLDDGVR